MNMEALGAMDDPEHATGQAVPLHAVPEVTHFTREQIKAKRDELRERLTAACKSSQELEGMIKHLAGQVSLLEDMLG